MRRRTVVLLAAAGALVVGVPVVAYGVVAFTNRDAPAPAALGDAPQARGGGPDQVDGVWVVADVATNFVGYRIRERLGPVAAPSDAVARTAAVEGAATIAAGELVALEVTVDLALLVSDSQRRDDFVRDEALDVARFPTGRLTLVAPVELPAAGPGGVVELSVPAELTLRDRSRPVDFAVQARWNGPTIQVAGSTEVQRSDFGIDVSSRAGFTIDEAGTVEFELTFVPDGEVAAAPPPTLVDNPATVTDDELRPPCQRDDPGRRLDPPVLVTASTPERIAVVSGGGQVAVVQETAGLTGGAAWSPDVSRVVYSASATVEDRRTLWVVPAAGGAPSPVPGPVDALQPDWGPDDRIAYVQRSGDGEESDIWMVRPDGSDAHVLVETPGVDAEPRWSPDGRSIVFTTTDGADNQDVMVVGAEGRDLRTVVGTADYEYGPSFTPDGESVQFVRDGAIHHISVDGQDEVQLTDGPNDANPTLSPDGTQLAFLREGSLFVAQPDGTSPACVVTNLTIGAGPRWNPASAPAEGVL